MSEQAGSNTESVRQRFIPRYPYKSRSCAGGFGFVWNTCRSNNGFPSVNSLSETLQSVPKDHALPLLSRHVAMFQAFAK